MAPSRRKGARHHKAAAAAAARRKWKFDDLVLAKVKGFPAWPAIVSNPEKWRYPPVPTKVVVQFFGTKEIAFCNPADIEEFTEEKKASLLGKRHKKGADFVRAVDEIINCFEKRKEQDQDSLSNHVETGIPEKNHPQESLTVSTRSKWNFDDLVLAKVEGFPAWPAIVSNPEKWRYPPVPTKVVVQFFGTKEIAFCNPADIEEFTEEKKASLLGKRHKKGADFVRAVDEIINCFEKRKEKDQDSLSNHVETGITEKNHPQESLTVSTRSKWNFDDLVLAKVEGFPAWPAIVSNPEKWRYPPVPTKVVVQFFGTKEIAFCNPADIEEFTEEKKEYLLGKRHKKGADFVRAVDEIINCFEKLKEQDQASLSNSHVEPEITEKKNPQESLTVSTKNEDTVATVDPHSVSSKDEDPVATVDPHSVSSKDEDPVATVDPHSVSMKDEDPVATVDPHSEWTTNDLDHLTEAAVAAAAAEDAFQNEDMVVAEKPSNLMFTENSVSPTYLTRNKMNGARSRNSSSHTHRRKPARRLRSSSRIDASSLRSTTMPSINSSRASMSLRASASEDRSLKKCRRIVKCSDGSEDQDVESLVSLANDRNEQSNSGMMSVDSDTLSINDACTVDSVSNLSIVEGPFSENNEGQMKLSDRLDFQSNNVIKKKRKPNRKRQNNCTIDTAKFDIVTSNADNLKSECILPSFGEKAAQKHDFDDGDEHLPLVKRARARMGRPSPAAEEFTLVHNEEISPEVPESHSVQSFELSSFKVDAPDKRESVTVKEEPPFSSLSLLSPANKPSFWKTRRNFVDGEADLPPSKRLHRALEAMSANVAEDCQRTSSCPPAVKIQSNGYCTSFSLECPEISAGKKAAAIGSGSGPVGDLSNVDSLLSASELFVVSDVERLENGAETIAVVSDCAKSVSTDGKNPELCTGSSDQEGGADTNSIRTSPFVEISAEINAIPKDHLKLDSVIVDDQNAPADQCKIKCTNLNEADKGSDPDIRQKHSDSTILQDIAGGSPNFDTCYRLKSAEGVCDAHRTNGVLSAENNQDSKMSEFVEESRPAHLNSKIMHPVTPVMVLNSGQRISLVHSVSYDITEDRTVSITQSSSSLTDGLDSIPRASPPSSSACNISAFDNNRPLGNNSSSCVDVQFHLEKAKLAGKFSCKGEALSSFEATIKSLKRTKESIGRATRIAIDCAKFGFAAKVVEILAQNLETESSLHKKVDLFFLVDSITQCSRGMKGDGGVYPSAIQALLPRLLLAAAPPSSSTHENHRQCLKVLKVWQERKILPEPIIRHHIRELDALCGSYPTMSSNRSLRNERAFDDPIREMEGMQVDEYGSNSSIQLPGFSMPTMLRDDDVKSDSDGESFEAVTPEHNNVDKLDGEKTLIPAVGKRRHILEDVDGELEMEDVAPCEDEITSASDISRVDQTQMSHQERDNNNVPLTSDSLSRSPLPPPPPLPTPFPYSFPPEVLGSVSNGPNSKAYSTSQEPVLQRIKSTNADGAHHIRENNDFNNKAEIPRRMPDSGSACFNNRPYSRFSGRASNSDQSNDAYSKSFHLRPPHPAPSNQFSYVQERVQSRRDIPPPSRPNRFHSRNSDNGNFYRDTDRNKFVQRDNIGEGWRPPFPSISGPCYPDDPRMANPPMSYGGPPREQPSPHNRWNFHSRPMNHRHFNPYRPPSEGPIPVANRGPNYWRPR